MVSVCKLCTYYYRLFYRLFTVYLPIYPIVSIKFGYLKTLVGLQGLNDEQQHYTFHADILANRT